MKSIFSFLSVVILFFTLIVSTFAVDAPNNLKLDSNTDTSVSLSWDTAEGAVMYYILYSKESGITNWYDLNTDLIENNYFNITDLESGANYYFSVVSFDENWDESSYSNELTVNLWWNDGNDFVLESVNVLMKDVIELNFSENLSDWNDPIREFRITNAIDDLDFFDVVSSELNVQDKSKITLILDRELIEWNEYEVVIVAITSDWGKNIESWIDNAIKFIAILPTVNDSNNTNSTIIINEDWSSTETAPDGTKTTIYYDWTVVVLSPDWSSTTTNPDWTITITTSDGNTVTTNPDWSIADDAELNSAAEEQSWVSWTDIAAEDIENSALFVAWNNSNLPKTWPEHILMLILSIILWVLIFIFKYKKA